MGNRKNKSRSQKRKFIGNRYTERTKPLDAPTCQKLHTGLVKKKLLNVASVVSKNAMIEAADEVRKLKNTSDVAGNVEFQSMVHGKDGDIHR
ncbi:hypothetical protein TNCV_390281 [Trichonephila clavipes]|nr:hypothetical protein TNCV_390281 [Trichonephila clavipes]